MLGPRFQAHGLLECGKWAYANDKPVRRLTDVRISTGVAGAGGANSTGHAFGAALWTRLQSRQPLLTADASHFGTRSALLRDVVLHQRGVTCNERGEKYDVHQIEQFQNDLGCAFRHFELDMP